MRNYRLLLGAALVVAIAIGLGVVLTPASHKQHAIAPSRYAAAWGHNDHYQLGGCVKSQGGSTVPVATKITGLSEIGTGGQWGAALVNGTIVGWGGNESGQASGNGTKTTFRACPGTVPGVTTAVQMSVNGEHIIVRLSDGHVVVWGSDKFGQECDGHEGKQFPVLKPKELALPAGLTATQVTAGGANVAVLLSDGTVMACGEGTKGELGDGTTTNKTHLVKVQGLAGIRSVAFGGAAESGSTLYAVTSTGAVKALGLNSSGQIGDGTTTNRSAPVDIGLSNVREVSAGPDHVLALLNDGSVEGWGQDQYGQLSTAIATHICGSGESKAACVLKPEVVPGLVGVSQVIAATHFSLAIEGGHVVSFGQNRWETLGDGTTEDKHSPTPVAGDLSGVSFIAGGYFNGYAITTTQVTPEVSTISGPSSLTLSWRSSDQADQWHVAIRPVSTPTVPFGKSIKVEPATRSYTFKGLTSGQPYEAQVDSRGFVRKVATGAAG